MVQVYANELYENEEREHEPLAGKIIETDTTRSEAERDREREPREGDPGRSYVEPYEPR